MMPTAKVELGYGPIPLILGVTGHRDIRPQDIEGVRVVTRRVLAGFRTQYPSTRIVVLSSLAEGADRLVAREALDLGMSIVVPMPLEQHAYEVDFATAESVEEFRLLLGRAEASFVVESPVASMVASERDARDHSYAACSAYIVRRCVELIALWDGSAVPSVGTAEAVTFQLDGIPAPYVPEHRALDSTLTGPVIHIATARSGARPDAVEPFAVRTLCPPSVGSQGILAFLKIKTEIDRFNHDVLTFGMDATENLGLDVQRRAEALAATFQRRSSWLLISVFACIFVAVLGFNVYQYRAGHPLWLLIVYLAFSACAFGIVFASKRADWQNRYQDYRAFAEGLRVAHYWRLAGIAEPVADRFAQSQGTEIDWLPAAIRAIAEPFVARAALVSESLDSNLRIVFDEWIVGQWQYFSNFAGRRDHLRQQAATRATTIGITLSIVMTFAILLPIGGSPEKRDQVILFAAAVCGLAAALLSSYAEKRGWAEHVKRYDFMEAIFKRARDRIAPLLEGSAADAEIQRVRTILRGLGEEAIRESAAWLSLHRTRPFEVPKT